MELWWKFWLCCFLWWPLGLTFNCWLLFTTDLFRLLVLYFLFYTIYFVFLLINSIIIFHWWRFFILFLNSSPNSPTEINISFNTVKHIKLSVHFSSFFLGKVSQESFCSKESFPLYACSRAVNLGVSFALVSISQINSSSQLFHIPWLSVPV